MNIKTNLKRKNKQKQVIHKGRNSNDEHMNTCLTLAIRPIQFKIKNKSNKIKLNIKSATKYN